MGGVSTLSLIAQEVKFVRLSRCEHVPFALLYFVKKKLKKRKEKRKKEIRHLR